jgi:hypothetical protein
MHEENVFSDLFLRFLMDRSMRTQANLVDQLFNSSEKRLARILLLMSEVSRTGETEQYLPKISQETLAEMVGTTRSRVSFFMNRFRKLGFIDYSDRIHVHKSLLNVVLHDQLPGDRIDEAANLSPMKNQGNTCIDNCLLGQVYQPILCGSVARRSGTGHRSIVPISAARLSQVEQIATKGNRCLLERGPVTWPKSRCW